MNKTMTLSATALAAAFGCAGPESTSPQSQAPETATDSESLILGTYTNVRPEIGRFPGVCTATLVSDRYALTAAHCYNYMTGPVSGSFEVRDTNGALIDQIPIDYHYALGGEVGPYDVSFVRLTRDAPAQLLRRAMTDAQPSTWQYVTAFGYGCQDRTTQQGGGFKQFYTYGFGSTTGSLCPGDSGGPQVLGFSGGTGEIWAVNSGFWNGSGEDILGYIGMVDAIEVRRGLDELFDSRVKNDYVATIPYLTKFTDVSGLVGDFNGDGKGDVAAIGRAGWSTITVAYGDGAGGFNSTVSKSAGSVPYWSTTAPHRVAGDFDGNGRTDIALLGNSAWSTIPIAFSSSSGNFVAFNKPIAYFQYWASQPGVHAIVGDYDGDGDDDIALTGATGWSSIPVAFSNRNGTFTVTNFGSGSFAYWAATPGARVVSGDFDGDGDDDLAVSGPSGWSTIPYASSHGDGTFSVYNKTVHKFPAWAADFGAELVAGDFDRDGDDDIAAVGGFGAPYTIALALSDGTKGGFVPAKLPLPNFPAWGIEAKQVRAFRMDRDASDDIVLMGGNGWSTVPVARLRYQPVRGG